MVHGGHMKWGTNNGRDGEFELKTDERWEVKNAADGENEGITTVAKLIVVFVIDKELFTVHFYGTIFKKNKKRSSSIFKGLCATTRTSDLEQQPI